MSGHSHWSTIKRKKGAADAKRGQLFTKLAREITIAARESGGDPDTNLRLQYAIDRARSQNMPKDNIERAVKRGTGELKEGNVIEEIQYEGYAPHGIALMIDCVTDNRNRAVAELRHVLSKFGGNLAEAGSVAWQFTRISYFSFPLNDHDPDAIFELAVEAGADDVTFDDDLVEIVAVVESFKEISDRLKAEGIQPEVAELRMSPNNETELGVDESLQVLKVIEAVEDLEDVQEVYSNILLTDDLMKELQTA
jgi:YebC/PmpR family DNA-binding regulatory protein